MEHTASKLIIDGGRSGGDVLVCLVSITSVEVLYSFGHILNMVPGKGRSAESECVLLTLS